ncbi:tetratricopeptide repeat protein, partial [Plesiocystis pacifica SIR-1]
MEVNQRIKARLKQVQDWNAVIDEVEQEVMSLPDASQQSLALFELARANEDRLLDKARAMQCYQKAFKLDQSNLIALECAREIYRDMAHLEMVLKLMGLELRANQDPARAGSLNYAYGTALLNSQQIDTAKDYLAAAANADPSNAVYQARFQETLYDRGNWEFALENVLNQLAAFTGGEDPMAADVALRGDQVANMYMRAARILQQESPEDPRLLPLLFKALDAEPRDQEAAFVTDTILAAGGHLQHIQQLQDRRASLVEDTESRIAMLVEFGNIWQVRLQNPDMAAYFYRQALDLGYGEGVAFSGHIAAYRNVKTAAVSSGATEGVVELAERA